MNDDFDNRWRGLSPAARAQLEQRDYSEKAASSAIPGVEFLPRKIFAQEGRGYFGEMARTSEGRLAEIGLNPQQWATARMFGGTAKGFHIHPPAIPETTDPAAWFQKLYVDEPDNFAARPYADEQWDVMFFVQGRAQMLLVDERVGMERRSMQFFVDGDNLPGGNNIGVIIPPGVAHAIRSASSDDLIMVYGTSTVFEPAFEGRIASNLEKFSLPADWQAYLDNGN
jgi:dTDP-4-dehydrorhamnose 3,5-epimerase-like enzyme